jgi:hypothetical protein
MDFLSKIFGFFTKDIQTDAVEVAPEVTRPTENVIPIEVPKQVEEPVQQKEAEKAENTSSIEGEESPKEQEILEILEDKEEAKETKEEIEKIEDPAKEE